MELIFLLVCTFMLLFEYYICKKVINVVSVLFIPYMFIIPCNNWFMTNLGFFMISDDVIIMLLISFICYFFGTLYTNLILWNRKHLNRKTIDKYRYCKIENMVKYVLFVETIILTRIIYIVITKGVGFFASADGEGLLLSGIIGHLFLTIYPLIPILFFYWLKNKEQKLIFITCLISIFFLFLTFVKYHVIAMLILIYLFVVLEDEAYLKNGTILLGGGAILLFISNYLIGFILHGVRSKVSNSFYFNHFWNYLSGSIIYDNNIFEEGVRVGADLTDKMFRIFVTPLNPFLNKIFGISLGNIQALPFLYVSDSERGNIVDAIGYLYPSKGIWVEYVLFGIIMFIVGIFFTFIYNISIKRENTFHITLCVFLTFFVFLSFYATLYLNPPPWEILIWSMVMPKLFDYRIKFKVRNN